MRNDESETVIASSRDDPTSFSSSLKSSESVHADLMSVEDCESLLAEHDYAQSKKQNKRSLSHDRQNNQFGICLHVANQVTSLQLCALCSENAQ